MIFAIAYNATGGSLTLAFLLHLMTNLDYPWEGDADFFTGKTLTLACAAILMAATAGRRWLKADHAATTVVPGLNPGATGR